MILLDALRQIAQKHQVVLSTHSPMFLSPYTEGTFIKIVKRNSPAGISSPYSEALPINLSDVTTRDQFQLICFDNNNAAFFAETVVLVEGDSDYISLAHIAKTLNKDWDFGRRKVALVRVNGKGSIARYREFFKRFEVRTCVVADLDVLVREFDKLDLPEDLHKKRKKLLDLADGIINAKGLAGKFDGEDVKKVVKQMSWKEQWETSKGVVKKVSVGEQITQDDLALLDALFEPEKAEPRLAVLKRHPDVEQAKRDLLASARQHNVFILERGAIEDYYPEEIRGNDKPSKAQDFCKRVADATTLRNSCRSIPVGDGRDAVPEFELICEALFSGVQTS